MKRYRIVRRSNGKYIAQQHTFWWFWEDIFCGATSDLPHEFDSVQDCQNAIEEMVLESSHQPGVVKEFVL